MAVTETYSGNEMAALADEGLPPEYAEDIPMDLLGLITGRPPESAQIPWHGPTVRIIENQVLARIKQDREFQALRDGGFPDDPRVGPSATLDWLPAVQVRPGLDYYCITTTLPIPAGSDPDAAPVGSFSWFPAGMSCRYPQIAGNGWAARLPGWDMSISALVAALMVLTGALRLRRQRRPNR